jgi:hypothetical protein
MSLWLVRILLMLFSKSVFSCMAFLKRILCYVKGTLSYGLRIGTDPVDSLTAYCDGLGWLPRFSAVLPLVIVPFSMTLWFLGRRNARRLPLQCRGRISCCCSCDCWVLWASPTSSGASDPLSKATLVFCDNVSAVYMAANPVHHRRTKHIEIDIHFVRKKVALGEVRVLHVPSSHQFDDIMTKGLPI